MTNENLHKVLIDYAKEYDFSEILFLLHGKSNYIKEVKSLEKKYEIFGEWKFFGRLLINIKTVDELISENFKGGVLLKKHFLILETAENISEFEDILKKDSLREEIIKKKEQRKLKEKINNSLKDDFKDSQETIDIIFYLIESSKELKDKDFLIKMDEVRKYVKGITVLNELFGKGKNFYNELKRNTTGGKNYE